MSHARKPRAASGPPGPGLTVDWLREFTEAEGLWTFDERGDRRRPHALLTSGLHSDGFVNGTRITERPDLLERVVAAHRAALLVAGEARPDWVFGSAFGAITLAHEVARALGCRAGFTEPDPSVPGALVLKRFSPDAGDTALVVEDVVTTGGSSQKTIAALEAAGVKVLPRVFALVDRSGGGALAPRAIVAAARVSPRTWKPEECPLCRQGSEAVRPKANWARLTGKA